VRTLGLLSLALIVCATRASAQEITDKETLGLKGPVKTVRMKTYRVAQGGADPDASLTDSEYAFDREGRAVEKVYYNPDGTVGRREVFTYDAAGRTGVVYGADGKVGHRIFRQKEEFDRERRTGRSVTTGEGYDGTLYAEFVRKYDERGRWLETSAYDREGKLQTRSVNVFGADGRLQEFLHYNGSGMLLHKYITVPEGTQFFAYDASGALVSVEMRRRDVCKESDPYGNCKSQTAAWTITKGGKTEEVTNTTQRSFTYY
jgi:hypothetical protein